MLWSPVVTGEVARAARERGLEVAERLRGWSGGEPGLEGAAGVAVLFGQLDRVFPEECWDVPAHQALAAAARAVEQTGRTVPGLYSGLSGVAAAADLLSRDGTRYGGLLSTLDARIAAETATRSERLTNSPAHQPFETFDVISGLSGTNRYLLDRDLAKLEGVVAVCGFSPDGPNWFTPPKALRAGTPLAETYREGVYNCGLAHGIAGPLAVLSIAFQAGHVVPGQTEGIAAVADWLIAHRVDDEWGPNWAAGVGPNQDCAPAHSAWCYGGPGVARALWLAGTALADSKLQDQALETMAAIFRRPWSARQIGHSPGLCHGVAGLLQITLRFAAETGEPMFTEAAGELTERLLELYRPDVATGYYTIANRETIRPHSGLLDGAAGAALALLAATTSVEPVWDRLLLLS